MSIILKKDDFYKKKQKQRRYKLEQPASSLFTMYCTNEVIHSHTNDVLTQKKQIMYTARYMRDFVEIMLEQGL